MTDLLFGRRIPVGSVGRRAGGWWGMMTLIATEGALFGFLLFSYYYLAVQHGRDWLPDDLPGFRLALPEYDPAPRQQLRRAAAAKARSSAAPVHRGRRFG